ncbi:Acetyltransferase (GNAT) family protein [Agrococcus baldri]|uniref:Acetyltransferase (GNAT) family protein n=1 Tax=Agrococcus baldri TaxID=153730 RepID=A0AA94HNL8_9MICO|nr:GNAT family N-acetyltransferase [Agrococcus baldri]SFS15893.1 Acetyltransferase (GNAT) family protein [Agrococcus baldri]
MGIEIIDVAVPERWDDDSEGARLLRTYVDVRNDVTAHEWGGDSSHAYSYQEAWSQWRGDAVDIETIRTLALVDGEPAGRGFAERGLREAQTIAGIDAMVLPEHRRMGVARALVDDLLARMRARGATTFQAWVDHHPAPGPQLSPPTGFGEIPAESPQVRLLQAYGFVLEQIERMSVLHVGTTHAALAEHIADAQRHAAGYRLETWAGASPSNRLDALARLQARMSTDAPAAGLDHEEETWDAARLQRYEQGQLEGGRTMLRAIAIDEATDAAVAFTTLVSAGTPHIWYQHDTLVHADHRGHRLGMLVKAANLLALHEQDREALVRTWNAEENRPMLRVNEALGFTAVCSEGAWQRKDAP